MGVTQEASDATQTGSNSSNSEQNMREANAITELAQEHCSLNINAAPAPKRKRKRKKKKGRKAIPCSNNEDEQIETESRETTEHATNECERVEYPNIHTIQEKKKLLILDINGVLADVVDRKPDGYKGCLCLTRKYVIRRPFCEEFLQFCFEKFHVAVWSSRTMKTLARVVPFIFQDLQYNLLFCWSRSECTMTGYTTLEDKSKPLVLKELRKVWEYDEDDGFDETNTLLVDDSPYKSLRNPAHSAIFPYPYSCRNLEDCALGKGGDIRLYLQGIADVETVPAYVATHSFGQKPISETNASWDFYKMIIG